MFSTLNMGGVLVTPAQLQAMQANDYILHVRDGRLHEVPVEKIRLPRDPQGHTQRLCMAQSPNGTLYAAQHTLLHKSSDGGRTWTHLARDPTVCDGWRIAFDGRGAIINVGQVGPDEPPTVFASYDDGLHWTAIGQIDIGAEEVLSLGFSMTRLADDTLLVPVLVGADRIGDGKQAAQRPATCRIYRSTDGGRTWPHYSVLGDWCCEVNVAQMPSGKLLASIRYQRPSLPDDPPDLLQRTGALAANHNIPFKHVFIAHSDDNGLSWSKPRQLATVLGQCYGHGVGLSKNRAIIVTDHRYPREMGGGRAMVSRDGGQTWANEVYYLSHGRAAGYAATLSVDGEEMLTLTGSCYGDVERWDNCIGRTEFVLVRWQLI